MINIQPKRRTLDEQERYSRLAEIRREIGKFENQPGQIRPPKGLVAFTCALMDKAIGRENRNKFLSECFHRSITSSKQLTPGEAMGLLLWASPSKDENWHPSQQFISDMELIRVQFILENKENLK